MPPPGQKTGAGVAVHADLESDRALGHATHRRHGCSGKGLVRAWASGWVQEVAWLAGVGRRCSPWQPSCPRRLSPRRGFVPEDPHGSVRDPDRSSPSREDRAGFATRHPAAATPRPPVHCARRSTPGCSRPLPCPRARGRERSRGCRPRAPSPLRPRGHRAPPTTTRDVLRHMRMTVAGNHPPQLTTSGTLAAQLVVAAGALEERDRHRQPRGREQLLADAGQDILRGQAVEEPFAEGLEEIRLLDVFLAIEHGHGCSAPDGRPTADLTHPHGQGRVTTPGPRAGRGRGRDDPVGPRRAVRRGTRW